MRHRFAILAAFILSMAIAAERALAKEEVVPLDKIPKAVMEALQTKFPQAKVDQCHKEIEGDVVVYDIEFKHKGRKCEADIKESGVYVNYEQAIEAKDLPPAVRAAIKKRYPKASPQEVMEETEVTGTSEKLSAFEVVLVTADKRKVEVRVSPDGQVLEDTGEKKAKE